MTIARFGAVSVDGGAAIAIAIAIAIARGASGRPVCLMRRFEPARGPEARVRALSRGGAGRRREEASAARLEGTRWSSGGYGRRLQPQAVAAGVFRDGGG